MKVVLTNLSNEKFYKSRISLNASAKLYGVDEVYSFDFETQIRNSAFYRNNGSIMSQKRGLGYWLWKPYIILQVLESLAENDIVIYSDCGIEIIDNLEPLISICRHQEQVLLFGNRNYLNGHYTKRDCFVLMNCDNERYWYSMQCDAAFMIFKKTAFTMQFVQEWLDYCKNETALTDVPNSLGKMNLPGFVEHRHDQSIISLLAEKYNISLYRMPTHHQQNIFLPVKVSGSRQSIPDKEIAGSDDLFEYAGDATFVKNKALNGKANGYRSLESDTDSPDKYNYLVSYLNSSYGKLLYHHRNPELGRLGRLKFKIVFILLKFMLKRGYRIERI